MKVLIYVAPAGAVDRIYENELVELKKTFDRVILLNYKNMSYDFVKDYVDGYLMDSINDPSLELSFTGAYSEELGKLYNASIV